MNSDITVGSLSSSDYTDYIKNDSIFYNEGIDEEEIDDDEEQEQQPPPGIPPLNVVGAPNYNPSHADEVVLLVESSSLPDGPYPGNRGILTYYAPTSDRTQPNLMLYVAPLLLEYDVPPSNQMPFQYAYSNEQFNTAGSLTQKFKLRSTDGTSNFRLDPIGLSNYEHSDGIRIVVVDGNNGLAFARRDEQDDRTITFDGSNYSNTSFLVSSEPSILTYGQTITPVTRYWTQNDSGELQPDAITIPFSDLRVRIVPHRLYRDNCNVTVDTRQVYLDGSTDRYYTHKYICENSSVYSNIDNYCNTNDNPCSDCYSGCNGLCVQHTNGSWSCEPTEPTNPIPSDSTILWVFIVGGLILIFLIILVALGYVLVDRK